MCTAKKLAQPRKKIARIYPQYPHVFPSLSERSKNYIKWLNPTIFGNGIPGGFDILMSQYGQVTKRHTFHDFAKFVFCLHTAGTENPDTPQTHPSVSNFHEYQSEHPQTPPRHPPDSSREHNMPTDDNRLQQTPPDILKQHLSVSLGVWRCLLTFCVPWICHEFV